jgi:histidine triad (HIT) family protein
MEEKECLFCKIVKGEEPSKRVLETGNFVVIENKFPVAPVHLLALSKKHCEKKDTISGSHSGFWDAAFAAAWEAIKKFGLENAYKIVVNGGAYSHFPHEHLHILGGTREEPGGRT